MYSPCEQRKQEQLDQNYSRQVENDFSIFKEGFKYRDPMFMYTKNEPSHIRQKVETVVVLLSMQSHCFVQPLHSHSAKKREAPYAPRVRKGAEYTMKENRTFYVSISINQFLKQ